MNDLKPQLAPGWSGVNIVLMLVLFYLFKPLGLLMLAYILFGARLGLNLARPETFAALGRRIAGAWKDGKKSFGNTTGHSSGTTTGGTPAPSLDRARELDAQAQTLAAEREALARERAAFEQQKRDSQG